MNEIPLKLRSFGSYMVTAKKGVWIFTDNKFRIYIPDEIITKISKEILKDYIKDLKYGKINNSNKPIC